MEGGEEEGESRFDHGFLSNNVCVCVFFLQRSSKFKYRVYHVYMYGRYEICLFYYLCMRASACSTRINNTSFFFIIIIFF